MQKHGSTVTFWGLGVLEIVIVILKTVAHFQKKWTLYFKAYLYHYWIKSLKKIKMAVVEAKRAMMILMILYACAVFFGFLAAVPMFLHVTPISECLLFSYVGLGGKLYYGHYASK